MVCGQAILQAKNTLNISRLLMICGQDNSAGQKDLEYFQVIEDLRPREFCRWKNLWMFWGYRWIAAKTILHAKKIFELFHVVDDLRPNQFCSWKCLWILSGYRWSAAKTNLQAKKYLNVFGILMIWGQDNSASEKAFECFHVVDNLRPNQFCRWNSLWIFSGYRWSAAKTNLQAKKS